MTKPLPPVDLGDAGWTTRSGQAVWKAKTGATELAGEVLLSTDGRGHTVIQFTKTPFPLVVGQKTRSQWQIEFPADGRQFSGPGRPPARIGWLQVPALLDGTPTAPPWISSRDGENWRIENKRTGEVIEGFVSP